MEGDSGADKYMFCTIKTLFQYKLNKQRESSQMHFTMAFLFFFFFISLQCYTPLHLLSPSSFFLFFCFFKNKFPNFV